MVDIAHQGTETREPMRWFVLALMTLSGCARSEKELLVFAAGSLRDAFGAIATQFTATRPGVVVRFNFAGTQELRTQLEHGAAADVFASADERHMAAVQSLGLVDAPIAFARNDLVVIVSREHAGTVTTLEQVRPLDRIVVGTGEVPVGAYTEVALGKLEHGSLGREGVAELRRHVVSRELASRQVLTRVTLGEASAGFVYRSDAFAALDGGVGVVELPADARVVAHYPMAVLVKAPHPNLARAWLSFVRSPEAQATLAANGFSPPEQP